MPYLPTVHLERRELGDDHPLRATQLRHDACNASISRGGPCLGCGEPWIMDLRWGRQLVHAPGCSHCADSAALRPLYQV